MLVGGGRRKGMQRATCDSVKRLFDLFLFNWKLHFDNLEQKSLKAKLNCSWHFNFVVFGIREARQK